MPHHEDMVGVHTKGPENSRETECQAISSPSAGCLWGTDSLFLLFHLLAETRSEMECGLRDIYLSSKLPQLPHSLLSSSFVCSMGLKISVTFCISLPGLL